MRARFLRRGLTVAAVGLVALTLTACSPPDSTALRLNGDGTVSFVSCDEVDVVSVRSMTYVRTGLFGQIDHSRTVDMIPPDPLDQVVPGAVYTFELGTDDWNRIFISVEDREGGGATAILEGTDHEAGVWIWSNPRSKCVIDE